MLTRVVFKASPFRAFFGRGIPCFLIAPFRGICTPSRAEGPIRLPFQHDQPSLAVDQPWLTVQMAPRCIGADAISFKRLAFQLVTRF